MLHRDYGEIARDSTVEEIGCGLGRVAFPLRYILLADGCYDGFDVCAHKIKFLRNTYR